ncbi:hypothetical protein D3C83_20120 [compost metagenome]
MLVVDPHLHAEPGALDFAAPYRRKRVAENKAPDQIGAARNGGEVKIALHFPVDVVEAFRDQR